MNYYGAGRTNYVRISDMDGLEAALNEKIIGLDMDFDQEGRCCFLCDSEGGYPYLQDLDEFDWGADIMPFVEPGQVLVFMQSGAEGLRYVTGYASAYIKDTYGQIRQVEINLDDIYEMAVQKFGVPWESISAAEY